MELKEISGHILNIGDRVKMNIAAIGEGDLDGVEFTSTGKNYWRYMNQHPDEIYTVVGYDSSNDNEMGYVLSGYMEDNNWYADELILVPEPKTWFEVIKNMTQSELADVISTLTSFVVDDIAEWLSSEPPDDYKSMKG